MESAGGVGFVCVASTLKRIFSVSLYLMLLPLYHVHFLDNFQIGDLAIFVGLLGIRFMFNFKNIVDVMSLGLRDDCLGARTSFIPPRLHTYSD
jgi:hypothetical protein